MTSLSRIAVLLCGLCVVTSPRAQAQLLPLESSKYSQQAAKGLVINEVYIGTTSSVFLATDQFVELYNPQTTVQYLDGDILVHFGANGKLANGALQSPIEAWKFPGTPGGHSLRVQPGAFVVIAATAKSFTNGVDLSNADFETYTGNMFLDQDSPSATNLTKIGAGILSADFSLSTSHDAVILADGSDTVLSNGINASSVIDGVQYSTGVAGVLPSQIDAGIAGGSGLKLGVSLERASKGVTTLNSKADFVLTAPTPGYQHGSQGTGGPVKVTDIFPLTRGRYVDYDAYTTDTLGIILPATKSHASYTIFSTGLNFSGAVGVVDSRDTSVAISGLPGKSADVHYLPTSSGDVQAFADRAFLETFVPAAFAALVTPPNTFVDYLKTSVGINKSYPVTTITQNVTQGGITATVNAAVTGTYMGVESVTVPKGVYDTAYKFGIKADIKVTAFGVTISSLSVTQLLWIVRGIGIVKTNLPSAKGAQFSLPGSERDMVAYGTRVVSGVAALEPRANIAAYPNPARNSVHLPVSHATRIELYNAVGQRVFSQPVGDGRSEVELLVNEVPNGSYLVLVFHPDGSADDTRVVIQH